MRGGGGGSTGVYICAAHLHLEYKRYIFVRPFWHDKITTSNPTDQSAQGAEHSSPRQPKGARGCSLAPCPAADLCCVCACVCGSYFNFHYGHSEGSWEAAKQEATVAATAAHKVSASSAKVSISQKLQIIFEPSACACVWSCLVTVASRNWRSRSSSSRRCRQNELASRSQSESLRSSVCVCACLCLC